MESQKQKEIEWRSILKHTKDALIVTDKKGIILYANHSTTSLLGKPLKEILNKSLKEVLLLFDSDTNVPVRVPSPLVFHKDPHPRDLFNAYLVTSNGRKLHIEGSLSPSKGVSGGIDGSVLIFRNASDKHLKEQEAIDSKKIEAIASISQNIALDFSSWLGIIAGHASTITENLIPNTRAYEEALRIIKAIENAGQLPRRLLSVARASNPDRQAPTKPVLLGKTIQKAIDIVTPSFTQKKIFFRTLNLDKKSYVLAEEDQLLDCLLSLFYNAADAMGNGGNILIDISTRTNGKKKFAVLRVRDTGIGIGKDLSEKVFDPFYSTKESETAIGLGLTVVKTSVESWGGEVKLRSQPGQGTSLRLFIPKLTVQAEKKAMLSEEPPKGSILIIDDDETILREIHDKLKEAGFRVYTAKNGTEGLDTYRKHSSKINLAIVDMIMPGKNGKQVMEEILDIDQAVQIIMTSGFSKDYARGFLDGASLEFIQKPFKHDDLLKTIHRTLSQQNTRIS